MSKQKIILENQEVNFDFNAKSSFINISFNRIAFIFFVFLAIFFIYSFKFIYLIKLELPISKGLRENYDFRSSIVDRHNIIIAKSVITRNIGINPNEVIDKKRLLINLKLIFPEKNFDLIEKKLNKKDYFYIQKGIQNKDYNKIFLLGDKSIKFEQKVTRVYPHKNLFSHIIGQIDDNNYGISGIEKYFDTELKSSKENLKLSLDANVQYLIRKELIKFEKIFNYKGSAAILMKIKKGEILSMVSLPDFDLNERKNLSNIKYINRASKAVYEFGSVFKTFTFAAGLEAGVIKNDTQFKDLEKQIKCGKNIISEYDEKIPENLTAEEILIRSGNIGSVRIGQLLGIEKYKYFLEKIGISGKVDFDIYEVGSPLNISWGKCKLATASFGHGITTTLLQLAKAYATITNGGFEVKPTLLKKNENNGHENKRVIGLNVSKKVNEALRKVVSSKSGTAGFANVQGYEIGGKTGTAQKTIDGKYINSKVNTFISIFPSREPKFVLLILLDEPKANQDYIYNYRDGSGFKYKGNWRNTAGWTTVEIAGKIIEKIGPILATKY